MKTSGLIFLVVLISISVKAVEPIVNEPISPTRTKYNETSWINFDMGTSLNYPIAFNIGLNHQLNQNLLTARFLIVDEMDLQNQSSSESIWDAGVLLGRVFSNKFGTFSIAAGLSYVGGVKKGTYIANDETWGGYYPMKHRSTLGIPLESRLVHHLSDNVGIGITTFGNLNLDKPFFGASLSLQLGIIR